MRLRYGRYLLHVFMEAGCLEWCVVIGLILRDANVIKQVIGFLDSPEVPQETVQSVKSGLLAVDTWASTDWWVQHVTCTQAPQLFGPFFKLLSCSRFSPPCLRCPSAWGTNHFST